MVDVMESSQGKCITLTVTIITLSNYTSKAGKASRAVMKQAFSD